MNRQPNSSFERTALEDALKAFSKEGRVEAVTIEASLQRKTSPNRWRLPLGSSNQLYRYDLHAELAWISR